MTWRTWLFRPSNQDADLDSALALAAAGGRPRAPTGSQAFSGLPTFNGVLLMGEQIDYLAAMRPPERWANVDKMLSDPTVWSAFMAWVMPVLGTKRTVVPGGTDPADVDIARFIEDDLVSTSTSMEQIRYEELLSLAYGVTVHEKHFEYREDKLAHLRNLIYLPPASIQDWGVDEGGGPTHVTQYGDGTRTPEPIPVEKLLFHTHLRTGGNIVGKSAFRAAYKPYWYKERMESVATVAAERGAMGIPVGKQTGSKKATSAYVKKVLQAVRVHQLGFVKETDDFTFRIQGIDGDTIDPLPLLKYLAVEIYRAMLAQHVALGSTETGSWALGKADVDFLVMSLQAVQQRIENTYNQHLIPQWVEYNWKNVPRNSLPRVQHTPLNTMNLRDWFVAVVGAVKNGVLDSDDQLRQMAREVLGVPAPVRNLPGPATEAEAEAEKPADTADGEEAPADTVAARRLWEGATLPAAEADHAKLALQSQDQLASLLKFDQLGIHPDFIGMAAGMDKTRDRIAKRLRPLQDRSARYAAERATKLLRRGDWQGVESLEINGDEEAAAIEEELRVIYGLGGEALASELRQQGIDPDGAATSRRRDDEEKLGLIARVMSNQLVDRLVTALGVAALAYLATGRFDAASLAATATPAGDALLQALGQMGASIGLNLGRQSVAEANDVKRYIYTTAMDANMCNPCAELDGQEFTLENAVPLPNPKCEGGPKCRCIYVPVAGNG